MERAVLGRDRSHMTALSCTYHTRPISITLNTQGGKSSSHLLRPEIYVLLPAILSGALHPQDQTTMENFSYRTILTPLRYRARGTYVAPMISPHELGGETIKVKQQRRIFQL